MHAPSVYIIGEHDEHEHDNSTSGTREDGTYEALWESL